MREDPHRGADTSLVTMAAAHSDGKASSAARRRADTHAHPGGVDTIRDGDHLCRLRDPAPDRHVPVVLAHRDHHRRECTEQTLDADAQPRPARTRPLMEAVAVDRVHDGRCRTEKCRRPADQPTLGRVCVNDVVPLRPDVACQRDDRGCVAKRAQPTGDRHRVDDVDAVAAETIAESWLGRRHPDPKPVTGRSRGDVCYDPGTSAEGASGDDVQDGRPGRRRHNPSSCRSSTSPQVAAICSRTRPRSA